MPEVVEDETTEYRMKFIEGYFKKKSKYSYIPTSVKSRRFINSIWGKNKWLFNDEWDDFISEIMLITTNVVMNFKPKDDGFDWSKVTISGTKEYRVLHDNINKAIKGDILKYANKINNNYSTKRNGKIEWHKPNVSSLDAPMENNDSDGGELIETLSDDDNLFNLKNDYVGSHFLDWFSHEYEHVLTKGQVQFLAKMKYFQREPDDKYTIPYSQLPDGVKPYSETARNKQYGRIRERTEKAYEQVEKMGLREMGFDKEIDFWQEFIELIEIEDERLHKQNRLLSKWIKDHEDNHFVEDILFDFKADDILEIRLNKVIPSSVLYKIVEMVKDRVDFLNMIRDKK
jgi:hypothetical protein